MKNGQTTVFYGHSETVQNDLASLNPLMRNCRDQQVLTVTGVVISLSVESKESKNVEYAGKGHFPVVSQVRNERGWLLPQTDSHEPFKSTGSECFIPREFLDGVSL